MDETTSESEFEEEARDAFHFMVGCLRGAGKWWLMGNHQDQWDRCFKMLCERYEPSEETKDTLEGLRI